MKTFFSILFLTFFFNCYSQIYLEDNVLFEDSSVVSTFDKKWENGTAKIKFKKNNDSTYLREEFYPDFGDLKSTVVVKIARAVDTNYIVDLETGEMIGTAVHGFRSKPCGKYIEFHALSGEKKLEGNLDWSTQTGVWKSWDYDGNLISVSNFDSLGRQVGDYTEYYPNKTVKQKGKYSLVEYRGVLKIEC